MFDALCVGTTTIDLYFKGNSLTSHGGRLNLTVGGKYFADFFYEGVGGGATNVSIGITKLGGRAMLYSDIGHNSFKRIIQDKLTSVGVSFGHCRYVHDYHNVSSILLTESGERTVVNYRSVESDFLHRPIQDDILSKAKIIYMGNLSRVSEWNKMRLLKSAKKLGKTTIVTLGSDECRKSYSQIDGLLANTDILIQNEFEFADLVRAHVDNLNWDYLEKMLPKHTVFPKTMIVTRASRGSLCWHDGKFFTSSAIRPKKYVDTSGAGDGYTAGFIYAYTRYGGNIQKAMDTGSKYSSSKLEHLGPN
jgi:2-dehydro-3-deoxygluconokinase